MTSVEKADGGDEESSTVSNKTKQKSLNKPLADYLEIPYEDLEIYERCGRGAYGSVYRGLWKSRNKEVAVKKLLQLENEAEVLSTCSHRNIIQFYGVVSATSNYCIITGKLIKLLKLEDYSFY